MPRDALSPAIVYRNVTGRLLLFNLKQSSKLRAGGEGDEGSQLRDRSWYRCRADAQHRASP